MSPSHEAPHPRTSGCQIGCSRLSAFLRSRYGGGDSGCFNPTSVTSSGSRSYHQSGAAIDIGTSANNAIGRHIGYSIFYWCVANADSINLQELIWHKSIITASRWHEGVRVYNGGDHSDHVHIALGWHAATTWSPSAITSTAVIAPPIQEEDDMEHGMAVDITIKPGTGAGSIAPVGYTLARWGSIHPFGGAKPFLGAGPYWKGVDVARKIVITDWDKPAGYVLDALGGVHPLNGAPRADGSSYWAGGKLVPFGEV